MSKPDFDKIFAQNGIVTPLTDSQFLQGFEYLGDAPPTREEFNWLFQEIGKRLKWLNENGRIPTVQRYLVAGTYTFVAPVSGFYRITVVGSGAGGGGVYSTAQQSSSAGGGAGGGYATKTIWLDAGTSVVVIVGKGGLGGVGPALGSDGETSYFGDLFHATGGRGGIYGNAATPALGYGGAPGEGVNGDINGLGMPGGNPLLVNPLMPASGGISGIGGGSILSGGTPFANNGNGIGGILGCGGSGADGTSIAGTFVGGKGGDGAVIIEY